MMFLPDLIELNWHQYYFKEPDNPIAPATFLIRECQDCPGGRVSQFSIRQI